MNKKNLYYITNTTPNKNGTGISYKIFKQINLFEKNGFCVHVINVSKGVSILKRRASKIPFINLDTNLSSLNIIKDNSYIYIRYFLCNSKLLHKLKKIRRKKNIRIGLEIPTYPYDGEFKGNKIIDRLKNYPYIFKDKLTRQYLNKYIDKIITFSDDKSIWGIPTINIANGVDVNKIQQRKPHKLSSTIKLIAVAKFGFWHGYDRMIEGLGRYYQTSGIHRDIKFYIVGYGNEKIANEYQMLIEKYNLEKHVILTGKRTGQELADLYNKCDIGVDSMGRHRSNVYYNSSLKGKEYLAKGLPIISGVRTELDNIKDFNYYLRVPADDSPIDIDNVISFYDSIYKDKNNIEISEYIRRFCEYNFNMDNCFEEVINWYKH